MPLRSTVGLDRTQSTEGWEISSRGSTRAIIARIRIGRETVRVIEVMQVETSDDGMPVEVGIGRKLLRPDQREVRGMTDLGVV